jgi:4,5-dihydroxyphthalate decarboxylase
VRVPVDGVDLTVLTLPVEKIFFRFTKFREWDCSRRACSGTPPCSCPGRTGRRPGGAARRPHRDPRVDGDGHDLRPRHVETLALDLPDGVTVERVAERSLNDLLLAGELDAILAPQPPLASADGRIVRLFSDPRAVEEASFQRTGVFPIMHLVVLRADVDDAHPWLAANLMRAFSAGRDRSLARVHDANASRFPVM